MTASGASPISPRIAGRGDSPAERGSSPAERRSPANRGSSPAEGRCPAESRSPAERRRSPARNRGTRVGRGVWLALTVALALLAMPQVAAADPPPRDLLPDLRMKVPNEMRITHQSTSAGPNRRLLRFSARMTNVGEGPMTVRGTRPCNTDECPLMSLKQLILRSDGSVRKLSSQQKARYNVGDGHHHFHVLHVERYMLVPLEVPADQTVKNTRAAKVGFCFFDTDANDLSLPGAPHSQVYNQTGCGTRSSMKITEGISVGWADRYPWNIALQWIDTTGLPDGRYLVCETADPRNDWLETREANNEAWSEIRLWRNSTGDHLEQLSSGRSPCADQVPDAPTALWELDPPEAEAVRFGEAATDLDCTIERS
jgi:hypothetical protein